MRRVHAPSAGCGPMSTQGCGDLQEVSHTSPVSAQQWSPCRCSNAPYLHPSMFYILELFNDTSAEEHVLYSHSRRISRIFAMVTMDQENMYFIGIWHACSFMLYEIEHHFHPDVIDQNIIFILKSVKVAHPVA